jgi:phospholipid/cholesterol/gamma-HCH transport system ATP-binding protein
MNSVEVEGLGFAVPDKQILSDVNLTIGKGEIVAVMGMSGSGKTTLLKCLAGLIKPTSGRIMIEGTDIVPLNERELDEIRPRIGLVFQYAALFDSLNVFENVAFGLVHNKRMRRSQVARIVKERLEEVGMEGTERLYPAQLSGGMQKRVGLARALAMEPAVLYYDEPTSGLDPVIAHNIDELIVETRDRLRMTSVVVSHDIKSIFRICDRIAMIHQGTIAAYGRPDELKSSADPVVKEFIADV